MSAEQDGIANARRLDAAADAGEAEVVCRRGSLDGDEDARIPVCQDEEAVLPVNVIADRVGDLADDGDELVVECALRDFVEGRSPRSRGDAVVDSDDSQAVGDGRAPHVGEDDAPGQLDAIARLRRRAAAGVSLVVGVHAARGVLEHDSREVDARDRCHDVKGPAEVFGVEDGLGELGSRADCRAGSGGGDSEWADEGKKDEKADFIDEDSRESLS